MLTHNLICLESFFEDAAYRHGIAPVLAGDTIGLELEICTLPDGRGRKQRYHPVRKGGDTALCCAIILASCDPSSHGPARSPVRDACSARR
jgi:hypothetical protein